MKLQGTDFKLQSAGGRERAAAPGPACAARRCGFTFIEVMFAVMILGFGVIMIAAMLPVAVRQTQNTRETNAGSAIIESGFHQLETVWGSYDAIGRAALMSGGLPATNQMNALASNFVVTMPSWGQFDAWADGPDADGDGFPDVIETAALTNPADAASFPHWLLPETTGSRINSASARDAWIPFYTRQGSLPPSLALVGVRVRNAEAFVQGQFVNLDNAPLPVSFQLPADYYDPAAGYLSANSRGGIDRIEPTPIELAVPSSLSAASPTPEQIAEAAVEGAVLVVLNESGQIRILTLSRPLPDGDEFEWELAPGGDVKVALLNPVGPVFGGEFAAGTEYRGYLIGRMLKDPSRAWSDGTSTDANSYVGPTQVIQVLEGKMLP
jgi:hypothetical protein